MTLVQNDSQVLASLKRLRCPLAERGCRVVSCRRSEHPLFDTCMRVEGGCFMFGKAEDGIIKLLRRIGM